MLAVGNDLHVNGRPSEVRFRVVGGVAQRGTEHMLSADEHQGHPDRIAPGLVDRNVLRYRAIHLESSTQVRMIAVGGGVMLNVAVGDDAVGARADVEEVPKV